MISRAPQRSKLYLPRLAEPPATLLEYLYQRFPQLSREILQARVIAGEIITADGRAINVDTPYLVNTTLYYYREVVDEPDSLVTEEILFQNHDLLIVDKPHFMPVIPAGEYINRALLCRLQRRLGISEISPVHRIDLETAGLVIFSLRRETRGDYQTLFQEGNITKEYLAVSRIEREIELNELPQEWLIRSRIIKGEPWFRMQIVDGEPNAVTRVVLVEVNGDNAVFQLFPATGKKHQLRLQLASLGFPIINDPLYPLLSSDGALDYTRPLQLLAKRLSFRDPLTGALMEFQSNQQLNY